MLLPQKAFVIAKRVSIVNHIGYFPIQSKQSMHSSQTPWIHLFIPYSTLLLVLASLSLKLLTFVICRMH